MHVAASSVGRHEGDQPLATGHHQRRGVVTGDIGGAQPHVEDPHQLQRLFPEWTGIDQVLMKERGVVDQQVEAPLFLADPLEQRLDLRVVAVVAGHGDAQSAGAGHRLGGFLDGARQHLAAQLRLALCRGAAGHVDDHAGGAQRERDALADATAGAGDHGDLAILGTHVGSSRWVC
ncbi:hypothetical protein D3C80_1635680 [compost metagenome]